MSDSSGLSMATRCTCGMAASPRLVSGHVAGDRDGKLGNQCHAVTQHFAYAHNTYLNATISTGPSGILESCSVCTKKTLTPLECAHILVYARGNFPNPFLRLLDEAQAPRHTSATSDTTQQHICRYLITAADNVVRLASRGLPFPASSNNVRYPTHPPQKERRKSRKDKKRARK